MTRILEAELAVTAQCELAEGPDLGTLYITTARQGYTDADRRQQPHAGDIFACTPGVTGRLPFLFAG